MEITIRTADLGDAEKLAAIYAYYVKNTSLTFEYDVPSVSEFRERIRRTREHYPYLVAEEAGEIIGYAYAGRFQPRAAYAWNAEMSIYLKYGVQRRGIGRQLYTRMEEILKEQGIVKTIAVITMPVDEYSDFNSVPFHEKMGYAHAGRIENCGFKFHRWYTTLYMDKQIGMPQEQMEPIKDFDEVRDPFGL